MRGIFICVAGITDDFRERNLLNIIDLQNLSNDTGNFNQD